MTTALPMIEGVQVIRTDYFSMNYWIVGVGVVLMVIGSIGLFATPDWVKRQTESLGAAIGTAIIMVAMIGCGSYQVCAGMQQNATKVTAIVEDEINWHVINTHYTIDRIDSNGLWHLTLRDEQ